MNSTRVETRTHPASLSFVGWRPRTAQIPRNRARLDSHWVPPILDLKESTGPARMHRGSSDAAKVRQLMRRLGEEARGPGRVYLVGGASAVIVGWRETTLDVDLKLDPEPPGVFEAIARAKDALDINVELAAPDEFIPPLRDWQARSAFITRHGPVGFFHYDFYAQALAKIERGHDLDRRDIAAMHERGLIDPDRLPGLLENIEPVLLRYPAIDPGVFRAKVHTAVAELHQAER